MPSPPPADSFKAGDRLAGRYQLVRQLGVGGMGVVWEALQTTTDKPVAIKILSVKDSTGVARFLREAKIAAQLVHRNVVQVFDCWEPDESTPGFMVMELLSGETLAACLAHRGALAVAEVIPIAGAVASGLRAAHARGIVHRDLKPANVFLSRVADGSDPTVEVKVLDFGLARPIAGDADAKALTQTGSVMGTPQYMPPEQVYGEKDLGTSVDSWALGVVIYECLAGQDPFPGDNFGQVFRAVTQGTYRPLREVAPHVPHELDDLVSRMLSQDRKDRPDMASVCELLAKLSTAPAAAAIPVPAEAPETVNASPRPTVLESAQSASYPSPKPPRKFAVALVVAGAMATLGAVLVLARPTSVKAPESASHPPTVRETSPSAAQETPGLDAPTAPAASTQAPAVPSSAPSASAAPPVRPQRGPAPTRAGPPSAAPKKDGDPLTGGRF